MENFRSKSFKDSRFQMGNDNCPDYTNTQTGSKNGMQDLRCYSTSYASSAQYSGNMDIVVAAGGGGAGGDPWKLKKGKSTSGASSKNWNFNDPELQRKKRVAGYKVYTVEGKVKGSIKRSFTWVKQRYTQMIYGFR